MASRTPVRYLGKTHKGCLDRLAESVAKQLDAEWQVPSRAAMGMRDVLLEAERARGHTFLTWSELEAQTLQHMNASGKGRPMLRHHLH